MLQRILSRLRVLGRKREDRAFELPQDPDELDRLAHAAPPDSRAYFYLRLGDIAAGAGDLNEALEHYGRAVDDHLQSGRYAEAAALCCKITKVAPDVVRARATLAFLLLGSGAADEVERAVADYVDAARRAGKLDIALRRLRAMAQTTDDRKLRRTLAHHLIRLDDVGGAIRVCATPNVLSATPVNPREQWLKLLRTEITGDRIPEMRSFEAQRHLH